MKWIPLRRRDPGGIINGLLAAGAEVRRRWEEAMLKLPNIPENRLSLWIQRGRLAAAAYAAIVVFVGFIYVVAMLVGGAWGAAFLGLLATIGGCGLAGLTWAGLYLTESTQDTVEAVDRLRQRVDMLESTVELHSAQAGLSATLVDDLSALVAGRLEEARYPRIVRHDEDADADEEAPERVPASTADHAAEALPTPEPADPVSRFEAALAAEDLSACHDILPALVSDMTDNRVPHLRSEYDRLVAERAKVLRRQFADLVRDRAFAAALRTGTEIETILPQSRMAADFRRIRSHLERRAEAAAKRAIS